MYKKFEIYDLSGLIKEFYININNLTLCRLIREVSKELNKPINSFKLIDSNLDAIYKLLINSNILFEELQYPFEIVKLHIIMNSIEKINILTKLSNSNINDLLFTTNVEEYNKIEDLIINDEFFGLTIICINLYAFNIFVNIIGNVRQCKCCQVYTKQKCPYHGNKHNALLILRAVKYIDPEFFINFSDELKTDYEFIKLAIKNNYMLYNCLDFNLKSNLEIILFTLQQNKPYNFLDIYLNNNNEEYCPYFHLQRYKEQFLRSNSIYSLIPIEMRYHKDVITTAVTNDVRDLMLLPHDIYNDIEFIKYIVFYNGLGIKYVSDEMKENEEIVRIAIKNNPIALVYASEKMKENLKIINLAIIENPFSIVFASENIKKNINIVKKAISKNGLVLKYMSSELKNNLEIVSLAITNNSLAIKWASPELQKILSLPIII